MTTGLDLTIVVGYDKHSWTAGWKHFMDGMTVFYSEWGDKQLEQRASFQATPQNIPMLRLQLNNLRLFRIYKFPRNKQVQKSFEKCGITGYKIFLF